LYKEEKELDLKEEKKKSNTFWKLSALKKPYNITVYTYSLAGRIREFKGFIGRRIPLNNYTRLNSWYIMLSVVI